MMIVPNQQVKWIVHVNTKNWKRPQENIKAYDVSFPNTFGNPRAMMIISLNTNIAALTVVNIVWDIMEAALAKSMQL